MPTFLRPLRPNPASILTLRKLTLLLTPSLSPERSNRKKFETEVYSLFVNYLKEAASKFHTNIYMYTGCSQFSNLHNITKNDLSTMAVSSQLLSSIMALQ